MPSPTLTSIHIYPVKGLRGIDLPQAYVEPRGLQHDRRWMLTDDGFELLTQREFPRLALAVARVLDGGIAVSAPGMPDLEIPAPDSSSPREPVRVWKDHVLALLAGAEADAWFSRYLGANCRLVYMDESTHRAVDPNFAREGDLVSFADGFPLLLASTPSLEDLNSRLDSPLPMNRFRPNLVISGCEPFEEDLWTQIRIGKIVCDVVKPCARCAVTTIDQETAEQAREPLRTLATFRRGNGQVYFAQNLIPRSNGPVRVGDPIDVLHRRDRPFWL